jgi:hypothetical protein
MPRDAASANLQDMDVVLVNEDGDTVVPGPTPQRGTNGTADGPDTPEHRNPIPGSRNEPANDAEGPGSQEE